VRIGGWRSRHLIGVRIAAMLSEKTVCVSHAVRRALVSDYHFSSTKTVVVHNGVNVRELLPSADNRNFIRGKLGIGPNELVLVCVARLSPMKGIDVLLTALERLLKSGHHFRCIIVGDGPLKAEIVDSITTLRLTDHVILEGFQTDVRPYLQAADIFVLSSHREGLPFSILEAMACELPCVVTNVGGNAEAVDCGKEGLIVNPGSAEELSNAIASLLTSPDVRTRMSQLAREKVRTKFDIDIQMHEYIRMLMNHKYL
jgi:glycosyltransferase involved in cell wall biosynthesis